MFKRIAAASAVIILACVLLVVTSRELPEIVKKEEAVKTIIFQGR